MTHVGHEGVVPFCCPSYERIPHGVNLWGAGVKQSIHKRTQTIQVTCLHLLTEPLVFLICPFLTGPNSQRCSSIRPRCE